MQSFRAVHAEVDPKAFDNFPWYVIKRFPNQFLRPIGRAGIHDHPAVDPRTNRREAAFDHMRLVLDDHVKTDGLA